LDMFVQGFPHRYLSSHTLAVSKTTLPTQTQIIVFTPWGMRDYR
jgi:hypothetical protein